jgi:hypothetical protein
MVTHCSASSHGHVPGQLSLAGPSVDIGGTCAPCLTSSRTISATPWRWASVSALDRGRRIWRYIGSSSETRRRCQPAGQRGRSQLKRPISLLSDRPYAPNPPHASARFGPVPGSPGETPPPAEQARSARPRASGRDPHREGLVPTALSPGDSHPSRRPPRHGRQPAGRVPDEVLDFGPSEGVSHSDTELGSAKKGCAMEGTPTTDTAPGGVQPSTEAPQPPRPNSNHRPARTGRWWRTGRVSNVAERQRAGTSAPRTNHRGRVRRVGSPLWHAHIPREGADGCRWDSRVWAGTTGAPETMTARRRLGPTRSSPICRRCARSGVRGRGDRPGAGPYQARSP